MLSIRSERLYRLVEFDPIRSDSIELERTRLSNSIRSNWFALQSIRSRRFYRSVTLDPSRSNSIEFEYPIRFDRSGVETLLNRMGPKDLGH